MIYLEKNNIDIIMKTQLLILLTLISMSVCSIAEEYIMRLHVDGVSGINTTPPTEDNGNPEDNNNQTPEPEPTPETTQCNGLAGRSIFTATCTNNVLSGTLGRDAITGTCENNYYHAILGRSTFEGVCNQTNYIDLSYSNTYSIKAGPTNFGSLIVSYNDATKVVKITKINDGAITPGTFTVTTSNGYTANIAYGSETTFPFDKNTETASLTVKKGPSNVRFLLDDVESSSIVL